MRTRSPRLHKLGLTVHIIASVGWIGALVAFTALAVRGVAGGDPDVARASYAAMDVIVRYAIVPLALATLVTGVLRALSTKWGLFRHYWVLFKLVIAVAASLTLLNETARIGYLGAAAASNSLFGPELLGLRLSVLAHSVGGLLVLVWAALLGVFKPRGTLLEAESNVSREPRPV